MATGGVLTTIFECLSGVGAATPPVAVPPTAAEVMARAPIPQPTVTVSPQVRSLAGLRVEFWQEAGTSVPLNFTDGFWSVEAQIDTTSWSWDTGDGEVLRASTAGSPDEPAASHVYQDRGTYPIVATTTWSGSYTVTAPGIGPLTFPIPPTSFSSAPRLYDVGEYQVHGT